MKDFLRRARHRGLPLAWFAALAIFVGLLLLQDWFWATCVFVTAAIGTWAQLRRPSRLDEPVSWEESITRSLVRIPARGSISSGHPLLGVVTTGDFAGRYMWVMPHEETWYFLLSWRTPWRWFRRPDAGGSQLADAEFAECVNEWSVRFLRQDSYSDEVWRRNFWSLLNSPIGTT